MTLDQIKRIHSTGTATLNKTYSADGKVFIGLKNGRLKEVESANKVQFKSSTDLESKTVQKVIEELLDQVNNPSQNAYKQFTYDGSGNITEQLIYEDDTQNNLLYTSTYSYTGDDLTTITITRASDSFVVTKTLTYDVSGNLTSLNIE
jgi:YD repeat-containing protein